MVPYRPIEQAGAAVVTFGKFAVPSGGHMLLYQNQQLERCPLKHHPFTGDFQLDQLAPGPRHLVHGDDHDTAISSILALRRGPISYSRNKVIVCEGDPTDYMFVVVKGVVRTCKTFKDGSRSVAGFHVPGELIGQNGELKYSLSTEAATDTMVSFLKCSALLSLAAQDNRVANFLLNQTANELRRAQEHALLIGRSAKCRVATFLIDLSNRMGQTKYLELPMPHHDIADYLGLKIETVSRSITELERSGVIARASSRTVVLRDRASLMRIMA